MRIFLILDDSITDKKILAYILTEANENPSEIYSFARGHEILSWLTEKRSSLRGKEIIIYCDQHLKPESGHEILAQIYAQFSDLLVFPVLMSGDHLWHQNAPSVSYPVGLIEKMGDLDSYQEAIELNLRQAEEFFASHKESSQF